MKERNQLEERKKEEKSEKLKDINNKRKEELLKNKIKDLPKNKERKRNNKINIFDLNISKYLLHLFTNAIFIFVNYEIISIK
jgi:hypothetical protein